jgi:RIO1 family
MSWADEGCFALQVHHLENPGPIYERMMDILCSITRLGLVHCDYNEFNVMLGPDRTVTVIDFPQMVSVSHANAEELFTRDVDCVMRFFRKKLNYWMDDSDHPIFADLLSEVVAADAVDGELRASGFNNEDAAALDSALEAGRGAGGNSGSGSGSEHDEAGSFEEEGDHSAAAGVHGLSDTGTGQFTTVPGHDRSRGCTVSDASDAELDSPSSTSEGSGEDGAQERVSAMRQRSAVVRALLRSPFLECAAATLAIPPGS